MSIVRNITLLVVLILVVGCSSYYGTVVKDQRKQVEELTGRMSAVQDKHSADDLAPVVRQYGGAFLEVFGEAEAAGQPGMWDLIRMKSQLEDQKTKEAATGFLVQGIRLYAVDFYGSAALKNAFHEQIAEAGKRLPRNNG